jgi:hypothetical protein
LVERCRRREHVKITRGRAPERVHKWSASNKDHKGSANLRRRSAGGVLKAAASLLADCYLTNLLLVVLIESTFGSDPNFY